MISGVMWGSRVILMQFSCVHKLFLLLREAISQNKQTNLCIEFSHFLFKAFQQIRILLSTASTQFLFVDIFTIIFLVLKKRRRKIESNLVYFKIFDTKGLFTWWQGTPVKWGNPFRWSNSPVHIASHVNMIKLKDYMDRQVTPPKRITSPTRVPPTSCEQTLSQATEKKTQPQSLSFSSFCPQGPLAPGDEKKRRRQQGEGLFPKRKSVCTFFIAPVGRSQ